VLAALAAFALAACSGERWLVGELLDESDAGPAAISADDLVTCAPADPEGAEPLPVGRVDPAHVGRWRADVAGSEASRFPSSALELEVAAESGRLRFVGSAP
jgi:hypothetical protein